MSTLMNASRLLPTRDTRALLIKWVVALLVPTAIFTFAWNGALIVNNTLPWLFDPAGSSYTTGTVIEAVIFMALFYLTLIALVGYLVATDSGKQGMLGLWADILIYAVLPILIISPIVTNNLIIGLGLCAVLWALYYLVRKPLMRLLGYTPAPTPRKQVTLTSEQQTLLVNRATQGSFWFGAVFALVWLIADIAFYATGTLSTTLLIWAIVRTILLPVLGYFLGQLAGRVALVTMQPQKIRVNANSLNGEQSANYNGNGRRGRREAREIEVRPKPSSEDGKDALPNDLPLNSKGAQRFYLTLLIAFVLFYPVLDPLLFGYGTQGRLAGYGDAGFYIILALGLNIVVGFAGLLDLGYVAFFAIGSYAWGMFGSNQWHVLTGTTVNPLVWSWFFWPFILLGALIAAFWGVMLGAPTLRLRGDYLAIVTLGFGEIVPIIFLNLNKYTNGTNGIVGVFSPAFPGVRWTSITPVPYYYLILALIVLTIFANIRLRDSRLGRAWIAMREDEIAASSSGINLVNTKLFAFGAGAFFSGVAGVYHAAKLGTVSPDNFSFGDSVIYLAMVVIGGIGSIPGVIVGAIVVYSINLLILGQLDTYAADPSNPLHAITVLIPGFAFGNIRNLIFGIILVTVMILRPEGLIPSARRRRELKTDTAEEVEVGSLDVPPGAPGFESEVRVE